MILLNILNKFTSLFKLIIIGKLLINEIILIKSNILILLLFFRRKLLIIRKYVTIYDNWNPTLYMSLGFNRSDIKKVKIKIFSVLTFSLKYLFNAIKKNNIVALIIDGE